MVVQRWADPTANPDDTAKTRQWEGFSLKLEGKHVNDWIVEDYLAEGAFGIVHKARHLRTGEAVALKIMKPEMITMRRLERFQREGIALGRIEHPNVVRYIGSGRAEVVGTPVFYIALELLEGRTLEEEITERGRLAEHYALWIAGQIVAALGAVAEHRIVHGDLKPSNVFLTNDGRIKVMDFGHATLLEFDNLTKAGTFVGTAPFAAPEQFVDSAQVDEKADQYSLGALIYYMLAATIPYPEATTLLAMAEAHQRSQTVPLRRRNPQISFFTQALVNRLMSKRKTDRFARLSDVAAILSTREQSNFFYTLLPERHLRNTANIFWSQAVFPRYPVPRCPAEPPPPLTEEIRNQLPQLLEGFGRSFIVAGAAGSGATRAVYEAFATRTDCQLARGRVHEGEHDSPFAPLLHVFEALFPQYKHPKFSWEEQFRFLTNTPPDAWSTLRILLNDSRKYAANFGAERDLRLAGEIALVLGSLGTDFPLVLVWDHCEEFDPRLISLLIKLIPKLEEYPVMSLCIGLDDGRSPTWGALARSVLRTGRRVTEFHMAPPATQHVQRLLGYFFRDEEDLRFLIRASLNYQFANFDTFFTWTAYWMTALAQKRMQLGRPRIFPGEYNALKDPLIQGSPDELFAGRWGFLSRNHQRALTVMAEEGEYFELPKRQHFRTELTDLELVRLLQDLERQWFVVLYRAHGHFRNSGWVDWIRRHPVPR